MKLSVLFCVFFSITGAQAQEIDFSALDLAVRPLSLVNWKVGETADFDVSLGSFGSVGTLVKAVTKEDSSVDGVWVSSEANLMGQKDSSEMLISRSSGEVLKYIHNGKEEAVPANDIEVVKTERVEVDVPAGHFKAYHLVVNTKDVKGIEIWVNPKDTVMEGTLKQTVPNQMGLVEVVLTKFHKVTMRTFPWPCDICFCDIDQ